MDSEVWLPVEGYTGYECSNYGRVRKAGASVDLRFVSGYGMRRVTLRRGDNFVLVVVADIILTAFVCPKPAGMKAYVIDGNYENLALPNLQWVKRKRDKYVRRKKQKRKSKRNFSKVIHTLVKSIKFIFDFLQLLKSIMEFFH